MKNNTCKNVILNRAMLVATEANAKVLTQHNTKKKVK